MPLSDPMTDLDTHSIPVVRDHKRNEKCSRVMVTSRSSSLSTRNDYSLPVSELEDNDSVGFVGFENDDPDHSHPVEDAADEYAPCSQRYTSSRLSVVRSSTEDDSDRHGSHSARPDEIPLEEDVDGVEQRVCTKIMSKDYEEEEEEGAEAESNDGDESDFDYEYDDDDDGHFSGFLASDPIIPSVPVTDREFFNNGPRKVSTTPFETTTAAHVDHVVEDEEILTDVHNKTSSAIQYAAIDHHVVKVKTSKWKDPSKEAVSMSLRAEKETSGGRRRLASDLYRIMAQDNEESGFHLSPKFEDSMDKWTIKLFKFDEDSPLHKDLLLIGMDHVELEMAFPEQYPFEPPFVRVVRPRFKRQTGFVMNGAICMELLTSEGWNPINDIESVIVSIRSLLVVGNGRLEAVADLPAHKRSEMLAEALEKKKAACVGAEEEIDKSPSSRKRKIEGDSTDLKAGEYSSSEARSAYKYLSDYHKKKGWDKSGWWANKG